MSSISVDASAFQSLQEALGLLKGELEKKDKHIEDLRLHTATLNQEITRLNGEQKRTREELRAGDSTSGPGESAQESLVPEKRKRVPDAAPSPPRKKGRPRKTVVEPIKMAVLPLVSIPRKRGRPRKIKVSKDSPMQESLEVLQSNLVTHIDLDTEPQSFPSSSINTSQAFVFSPSYTSSGKCGEPLLVYGV
ncbi:hypothetical protein NMY22_g1795 [Coprinellus aureogranulatus]|nr:hypothetical protein NMY22_g1795 [Coprinellus aureogranulatus]